MEVQNGEVDVHNGELMSMGNESTGIVTQIPDSILEDENGDDDSDMEDFEGAEQVASDGLGATVQLHAIQRMHQPITLVNGQRINEGFRKPEKTKWTIEEGTYDVLCPAIVIYDYTFLYIFSLKPMLTYSF